MFAFMIQIENIEKTYTIGGRPVHALRGVSMEIETGTVNFIIGPSGSGKSTIGPIIANAIGYEFIDLDTEIELRHDRTITSLFNELGESGFRASYHGLLGRPSPVAGSTRSTFPDMDSR